MQFGLNDCNCRKLAFWIKERVKVPRRIFRHSEPGSALISDKPSRCDRSVSSEVSLTSAFRCSMSSAVCLEQPTFFFSSLSLPLLFFSSSPPPLGSSTRGVNAKTGGAATGTDRWRGRAQQVRNAEDLEEERWKTDRTRRTGRDRWGCGGETEQRGPYLHRWQTASQGLAVTAHAGCRRRKTARVGKNLQLHCCWGPTAERCSLFTKETFIYSMIILHWQWHCGEKNPKNAGLWRTLCPSCHKHAPKIPSLHPQIYGSDTQPCQNPNFNFDIFFFLAVRYR